MSLALRLALAAALMMPAVAGNASLPRRAHLQEVQLPEPTYLPQEVRAALRIKMTHHQEDLALLLQDVTLLRREAVAATVTRIAEEPRLARPIATGGQLLNRMLPPEFFDLQDELLARALAVRVAAESEDDVKLAEEFGKLNRACVRCHSVYLRGPGSQPAKKP